ncbi:MAG TPA: type II toxin-antitoxin system VapC family toxin [Chthonomonadaceae bacterium]|nr:type II toxin-antitoxin system VapC family toxin [Chthonomonadaceae bacterium]
MASTVLIDTDILIDAGRGVAEAVDSLRQHELQTSLAISVISQLELFVGCQNKREFRQVEKFLERFEIVDLDTQASSIAVDLLKRYRLSHGLLIPDALIAATALAQGLPLLTKNQRDYRFINGLILLPYP